MEEAPNILTELENRFGTGVLFQQGTRDQIPTFWVPKDRIIEVLRYLKHDIPGPFAMLYDLTAIDERLRTHRADQPESDFSVVYNLISYDRNQDLRLKVALKGGRQIGRAHV